MRTLIEDKISSTRAPKKAPPKQNRSVDIDRLKLALDHDTTGVTIFDQAENLQYANRAFLRAYGISHVSLKPHAPLDDLLQELVKAGIKATDAEQCLRPPRASGQVRQQALHSLTLPSGFILRIQHIRPQDGGWVTRHAASQDVQLRSALSDDLLSLQTLIDQVTDYLWIKDLQSHFIVANKALAQDSGLERSTDLIGLSDFDLHDPEKAQQFRESELAVIKSGKAQIDNEEAIVDAEGNVKTFSSSKMPLRDDNGEIIGLIGVARDISCRKKAEEHRRRAFEAEETSRQLTKTLEYEREINAQQRQFVSMASHEFRTPLAIIDGAAQRLLRNRDEMAPEYVGDKAQQIRNAVARVVELMESILSFEKLASGAAALSRDACNLGQILAACCDRQAELSPEHAIAFDPGSLPPTFVGDKSALEQVFTNLLSNAVKYSPDAPQIEVKGWVDGSTAHIAVSDHGLGMDEDDVPKVFERFFRARTATGIAGTGIGLHLAKQIVELHGGNITVESQRGKGSTFTVSLPLGDVGAGI